MDPLALVWTPQFSSYPTQSSKSPQPTKEPSPADNFQLDLGSSSTENLIESLSNTLALLTQSYKSHLPQTNNQLRASSNARTKLCSRGKVVVQMEALDFNSFFKIKNLEHQIQEKDNVIRHLKDLVANVNDRSCEPYNAKDVTALIEQQMIAIRISTPVTRKKQLLLVINMELVAQQKTQSAPESSTD
ncbi:hypothetical protein Tco_1319518 [Tanacetum coccineum]